MRGEAALTGSLTFLLGALLLVSCGGGDSLNLTANINTVPAGESAATTDRYDARSGRLHVPGRGGVVQYGQRGNRLDRGGFRIAERRRFFLEHRGAELSRARTGAQLNPAHAATVRVDGMEIEIYAVSAPDFGVPGQSWQSREIEGRYVFTVDRSGRILIGHGKNWAGPPHAFVIDYPENRLALEEVHFFGTPDRGDTSLALERSGRTHVYTEADSRSSEMVIAAVALK